MPNGRSMIRDVFNRNRWGLPEPEDSGQYSTLANQDVAPISGRQYYPEELADVIESENEKVNRQNVRTAQILEERKFEAPRVRDFNLDVTRHWQTPLIIEPGFNIQSLKIKNWTAAPIMLSPTGAFPGGGTSLSLYLAGVAAFWVVDATSIEVINIGSMPRIYAMFLATANVTAALNIILAYDAKGNELYQKLT